MLKASRWFASHVTHSTKDSMNLHQLIHLIETCNAAGFTFAPISFTKEA